MRTLPHPLGSTIIFGLLCGLLFIPLAYILSPLVYWPQALFLPIWTFMVVYSGILACWSRVGVKATLFPLVLILVTLPWVDSMVLFMILILGTLGWIRSGVCYSDYMGKRMVIELFLCLVAGGLLAILNPTTLLTWGLAVWMLFLVQALYFVFFDTRDQAMATMEPDPFEYAREQAENILARTFHDNCSK